jgi:ribosome-binding protein aMBF1 (putative translation factor)
VRVRDPRQIDWAQVVEDIRAAGLSARRIAASIGVPRSTIQGYKHLDAEPRYEAGARLLQLWETRTGRPRSEAPIMAPRGRETGHPSPA